ncbi:hypothetical protein MVG78_13975 [Roseomonas gilardii subsp. gilardii]|uniref:hypothetical protein n=1 Tax=Roseomonas gilardii TaxID=257708 RepID=UPI001FFB47B7|nr:hypothetical protein [Roseomonas gilardii]UPG71658.1 hypothetical protein MVG78_13975 [Roseomonas gilardii subsp. gilardii]
MDPLTRLLIQMVQWWRHPPGRRKAMVILVALALSLLLVTIERTLGWPSWLRTEPVPIRRLP